MFQCHSSLQITIQYLVISSLAPPAWNSITRYIWCKLFNVLSIWWYIKFYVFFCCFTAAQSNAIHLCMQRIIITFFEWGDLERTRHSLATWQDSRWRRIFDDLFSCKSFHICAKKPQDIWVDRTFSKSKGKFFMEIVLLSKYSWKRNRFSIVIVNICETRNEWLIQSYISFDVTDGHGLKWCIKMDKLFVSDYLSPCVIKLGVVQLCVFCVVMQLPELYENKRFHVMPILILEVCRFFVWFYRKNVVVITRWCNFRQQRSVLTQFW